MGLKKGRITEPSAVVCIYAADDAFWFVSCSVERIAATQVQPAALSRPPARLQFGSHSNSLLIIDFFTSLLCLYTHIYIWEYFYNGYSAEINWGNYIFAHLLCCHLKIIWWSTGIVSLFFVFLFITAFFLLTVEKTRKYSFEESFFGEFHLGFLTHYIIRQ